jgi:hypothetical protein
VTELPKIMGQGLSDCICKTMLPHWPSENSCQWRQHNRIMGKNMVLELYMAYLKHGLLWIQ